MESIRQIGVSVKNSIKKEKVEVVKELEKLKQEESAFVKVLTSTGVCLLFQM